jgi:hypothetical protein
LQCALHHIEGNLQISGDPIFARTLISIRKVAKQGVALYLAKSAERNHAGVAISGHARVALVSGDLALHHRGNF